MNFKGVVCKDLAHDTISELFLDSGVAAEEDSN